jgi:serine/threonine-protein kinase RsbT
VSSQSAVNLRFEIISGDFTRAGEASTNVKQTLKKLGVAPDIIRRAIICMYEAEMNMIIHSDGGTAEVAITPASIDITMADQGPGIPDLDLAMKEGYSTAPDLAREFGYGAGMGLPNMKRNADVLDIDSKAGRGTTVRIGLKLGGS